MQSGRRDGLRRAAPVGGPPQSEDPSDVAEEEDDALAPAVAGVVSFVAGAASAVVDVDAASVPPERESLR